LELATPSANPISAPFLAGYLPFFHWSLMLCGRSGWEYRLVGFSLRICSVRSQSPAWASAVKTPLMGIKVVLSEGMPLPRALGALRVQCRRYGIQIGKYVRQADRNRRKDYFEKPGVKRRRKRHLAAHRRRRGEMGFSPYGRL